MWLDKNISYKVINKSKKEFNKVSFIGFEAIVQIPNPLTHLIELAGGLQERGTGFHEKFISA